MSDDIKRQIAQQLAGTREIDQVAMRTRQDPVRSYLDEQSRGAIGDMGANVGKAGLAAGMGFGSAGMTGPTGPIIGALLAAGYTGQAIADLLRSQEMSGASQAFGQTGMPGAPTGPAMPMSDPQDMRVGRFANPKLTGR